MEEEKIEKKNVACGTDEIQFGKFFYTMYSITIIFLAEFHNHHFLKRRFSKKICRRLFLHLELLLK